MYGVRSMKISILILFTKIFTVLTAAVDQICMSVCCLAARCLSAQTTTWRCSLFDVDALPPTVAVGLAAQRFQPVNCCKQTRTYTLPTNYSSIDNVVGDRAIWPTKLPSFPKACLACFVAPLLLSQTTQMPPKATLQ